MRTGVAFWTAGICCFYFSLLYLFQFDVQLISILPPILYTFYIIVTGKRNAVYWEKKQLFLVLAVALGIEIFAGLVMEKDMTIIFTYVFTCLLLMSVALNIFRFGPAIDKQGKFLYVLNLGLITITCGACAWMLDFIGKKGSKIIEIILTPFALILAGIVSLGSKLSGLFGGEVEELIEQTEKIEEQVGQNQEAVIEQTISNDMGGESLDWLIKVGLVVALVLFLMYILYRLYCFYKERYVYIEDTSEITGTTEAIGRKGFSKISLFKTNREKIRKEYAKHMRSVRVQGCRISKSSTSLDICSEAKSRLNHEDLIEERIRELYIKARYSNEEITDEEVKEMRQLV